MKFVVCIAALAHSASALKSVGVSFGPQNCVGLTRSQGGSCVISTNCEGIDTSVTEFAFDCVGKDVVRHSFGVGGFESSEEFDTEVKCGRCASVSHHNEFPTAPHKVEAILKSKPAPVVAPKATKHEEPVPGAVGFNVKAVTAVKAKSSATIWPFSSGEKKAGGGAGAVKYGPGGCVSVWRNEAGHCVMKTDCEKPALENYEFGLVCVDKTGSPVKHLFGKNSFDPKETFDTLIKCDQCLGMDDIPDQVSLAGEVASMAKEVSNLKDVMKNISINVNMLNKKVFPQVAAAPGPAAAAPAPAAAKPVKLFVHSHSRRHHRGNLRHSHHRHHRHHRRQEDDDDREEEDDRDGRDDRDDRDDDGFSSNPDDQEPARNPVDDLNAAAVQMQQAQAAAAATQAQVQSIPMNTASNTVNAINTPPAPHADDDDDDSDDGED